jgi:hypothetical protein
MESVPPWDFSHSDRIEPGIATMLDSAGSGAGGREDAGGVERAGRRRVLEGRVAGWRRDQARAPDRQRARTGRGVEYMATAMDRSALTPKPFWYTYVYRRLYTAGTRS